MDAFHYRIKQDINDEDKREGALKMIQALAHNSREIGLRYDSRLRKIMRKTGVDNPKNVRKGVEAAHRSWAAQDRGDYKVGYVRNTVGEWEGTDAPDTLPRPSGYVDYLHRDAIHAAVVLTEIFPEDQEARASLRAWHENHPSLRVRAVLKEYV